jgi:transcription elongation factor
MRLALAGVMFGASLALVAGESGTTDANTGYNTPAFTSRYPAVESAGKDDRPLACDYRYTQAAHK